MKTEHRLRVLYLAAVVVFMAGAAGVGAQSISNVYEYGNIAGWARFSDFRQELSVDAMVPLWMKRSESGACVLLLNPRASFEESYAEEYNLGLVARHLFPEQNIIAGLNAYYDTRDTEYNNRFHQFGAGAEVLSEWVDARFNYYWPEDDREEIDSFEETEVDTDISTSFGDEYVEDGIIYRDRYKRIVTTTTTRRFVRYEVAQEGFDGEVGVRVPALPDWLETRVFAGYYDFETKFAEDRMEGFKGRLEVRPMPGVVFDAEVYENKELTGADFSVGGRVAVPFDLAALSNGHNPFGSAGDQYRARERVFEERLFERVLRDLHIQTEESEYMEDVQSRQVNTAVSTAVTTFEVGEKEEESPEQPYEPPLQEPPTNGQG